MTKSDKDETTTSDTCVGVVDDNIHLVCFYEEFAVVPWVALDPYCTDVRGRNTKYGTF